MTNELLSVLPPALSALLAAEVPIDGAVTVDNDSWEDSQYERGLINAALRDVGVQNFGVLSGDLHTYVASYVKVDYNDPDNTNAANVTGVEYMTPAITSSNLQFRLGLSDQAEEGLEAGSTTLNKHLVYLNSHQYGYATVQFTRSYCEHVMYVVDKETPTPGPAAVVKRFRTPAGEALIQDYTNMTSAVRPGLKA